MLRRLFHSRALIIPIVMGVAIALLTPRAAHADDLNLDPEQIKAALHTITAIEGGFIDRTVAMVNAGTLPRDLFTSCFIWARKRPHHKFEYFQQALTIRAAQIGIIL